MNELKECEHNIRKQIVQMMVHIDNVSYEALMNMPVQDRDMLTKAHNIKIDKMNDK